MRQQKSCASLATVFVSTNRYSKIKTICLPVATNSDIELINYASIALKEMYREGYWYKKSGVIVTEIVPENQIQLAILDTVDRCKHTKLMQVSGWAS
ncbi:hypothetical protein [uncultured Pontibacter sp.]|uniref:DinB/UmuC family translesion DNA polymerase n=1 Tax=uncultured Pontibacter sp. TaxID=453356 RepID=UPI00344337AD